MGTRSNISNLDSLILSDDERPIPVLKIQDDLDSKIFEHDFDSSCDSDSSYEAKAKACADEMDGLIAEAKMERDEKNRRIRQARMDKLKEKEDKQNSFGRKFDPIKAVGRASGSGTSNVPGILNINLSSGKPSKKSRNVETVKTGSVPKTHDSKKSISKKFTSKASKNEIKSVAESQNVPSKLKNVTIQDFDVESTDTCSDYDTGSDFEMDREERMLQERLKTFTIKRLNQVEMLELEEFFDSDESEEKPKDQKRCYYSAEKSSAANRRKKSNYLNKRRSNFKKSNSTVENQSESTESKKFDRLDINLSNKEPGITQTGIKDRTETKFNNQFKKVNKSKNNKSNIVNNLESPIVSSGSHVGNANSSGLENLHCISSISAKNKRDNKFRRKNKHKNPGNVNSPENISTGVPEPSTNTASGSVNSVQNLIESNTDSLPLDKVKSRSYHKKNDLNAVYANTKLQDQKESKLKKLNEERIIPKYSGCTNNDETLSHDKKYDDIIIEREISLINNSLIDVLRPDLVHKKSLDLELNLSDDEIDVPDNRNKASTITPKVVLSSDSEDIDFKAIVESMNKGADKTEAQSNSKEVPKETKTQGEDSSDFEAELEACLVKFK